MENKAQKFEISRRFPMDFMLKQLLIVLVLLAVTPYIVGIVLALLAKLRLLPLAVCGLVLSCLPNWAAAHRPLAIGLLAACALYPIVYWTLSQIFPFKVRYNIGPLVDTDQGFCKLTCL